MITRTFHPIGQGAFYSERVGECTTVYDCGVWRQDPNKKRAEQVIKAAFTDNATIDILFISHFDYDHVSMIPFLLEKFTVKRIVMPLLEASDQFFLANIFENDGEVILGQLVGNPALFSETRKIEVVQVRPGESPNPDANTQPILLNDLITGKIDSGTRISDGDWIWVPFNYKSLERSTDLFARLTNIGLDPKQLTDSDYFDKHRSDIRKAYTQIDGNINENSMFLYSGPSSTKVHYHQVGMVTCNWHYLYHETPSGCIFTGDGDLNKVSITNIFSQYLNNVGTIQVPHHGSKGSYNELNFPSGEYICPISVGEKNSYGHPSGNVLASLLANSNQPFIVTENAGSVMVTHWY